MNKAKFTVIGGGTGTYSVLSGLKKYTDRISAIVSMADSGGSAKKERDEWGLLPSSDVRKSLLALADVSNEDSLLLRKLFQYRYDTGRGLKGVTFGNLFLVTLSKILGSQKEAIKKASELLNVKGDVIPVSMDKCNLVAEYQDGSVIKGEHFIDDPKHNGKLRITKLYTQPEAEINPDAKKSISECDVLIVGPGGFYTTVLANFAVKGVREAVEKSNAKKFFIMNLMTEFGQTYNFRLSDYMEELDKFVDTTCFNFVVINSGQIPELIKNRYKRYNAIPVVSDIKSPTRYKIVHSDLISKMKIVRQKGDGLKRSFIRHDGDKIASLCMKLSGML